MLVCDIRATLKSQHGTATHLQSEDQCELLVENSAISQAEACLESPVVWAPECFFA